MPWPETQSAWLGVLAGTAAALRGAGRVADAGAGLRLAWGERRPYLVRPRPWLRCHQMAPARGELTALHRRSPDHLHPRHAGAPPRRPTPTPTPTCYAGPLFGWAFNPATHDSRPPRPVADALDWAATASLPVVALADPRVLRRGLDACTRTLTGAPAAGTVVARKRAVIYNALGYAVEAGTLTTHPADRLQWTPPEVADAIDRRAVANPTQATALLAAVAAQGPRGQHLQAFFGCLYYAALRPAEAVALTQADLHLPDSGWGRIDLARSAPKAGRAWTDTGTARDHRGLKHRARNATRTMPIPPELVTLLRDHLR